MAGVRANGTASSAKLLKPFSEQSSRRLSSTGDSISMRSKSSQQSQDGSHSSGEGCFEKDKSSGSGPCDDCDGANGETRDDILTDEDSFVSGEQFQLISFVMRYMSMNMINISYYKWMIIELIISNWRTSKYWRKVTNQPVCAVIRLPRPALLKTKLLTYQNVTVCASIIWHIPSFKYSVGITRII